MRERTKKRKKRSRRGRVRCSRVRRGMKREVITKRCREEMKDKARSEKGSLV